MSQTEWHYQILPKSTYPWDGLSLCFHWPLSCSPLTRGYPSSTEVRSKGQTSWQKGTHLAPLLNPLPATLLPDFLLNLYLSFLSKCPTRQRCQLDTGWKLCWGGTACLQVRILLSHLASLHQTCGVWMRKNIAGWEEGGCRNRAGGCVPWLCHVHFISKWII